MNDQTPVASADVTAETITNDVVCTSCDEFCPVSATIKDGQVVKVTPRVHPFFKEVIYMKDAFAPKAFAHLDRLLYPLKRKGARGDNEWQRVSWALRSKKVWGQEYANLVGGCYMAGPKNVFKAMAMGDPYAVKAFIALANKGSDVPRCTRLP